MQLYRMVYLKDSRTHGATFAALDAHHANERAEAWADRWGAQLLTVNHCRSREPRRPAIQPGLFAA